VATRTLAVGVWAKPAAGTNRKNNAPARRPIVSLTSSIA